MKALQLNAYGDPKDVIKLIEQPEFGPLAPDEWVIDMEAVPVSPTDLYIIAGIYGELPPLPHGLGCEGVGRVSAIGSGVKHVKVGDLVIAPLLQNTTWSTRIKTNETWQRALPDGKLNQMAQVSMNPITALLILTEFKKLKAGDIHDYLCVKRAVPCFHRSEPEVRRASASKGGIDEGSQIRAFSAQAATERRGRTCIFCVRPFTFRRASVDLFDLKLSDFCESRRDTWSRITMNQT